MIAKIRDRLMLFYWTFGTGKISTFWFILLILGVPLLLLATLTVLVVVETLRKNGMAWDPYGGLIWIAIFSVFIFYVYLLNGLARRYIALRGSTGKRE